MLSDLVRRQPPKPEFAERLTTQEELKRLRSDSNLLEQCYSSESSIDRMNATTASILNLVAGNNVSEKEFARICGCLESHIVDSDSNVRRNALLLSTILLGYFRSDKVNSILAKFALDESFPKEERVKAAEGIYFANWPAPGDNESLLKHVQRIRDRETLDVEYLRLLADSVTQ